MAWKGDPHAFHDDVDGEIDALTEKASPVDADLVIINDSADGNSVKSAQLGNLPGGGGSSDLDGLSDVTITSPEEGQALVHDGSEWANRDLLLAVNDIRTLEIVEEAAPKTTQSNAPHAVYDPVSHRTYLAYEGLERDLYVTYYDHYTADIATPVEIDVNPLSDDNTHGVPTLAIDHDGHLHIVWGAHNSTHEHLKSDNPWDISAWTSQTISGAGTYPYLVVDPATGDLYLFDRAGSGGHSSPFPSHAYGAIRKLPAGSTTWGSASAIVDTTGSPESASDFYQRSAVVGDDGLFHIMWTVARGSGHDDNRTNIYHAKYDPADGTLYAADGTNLGSTITWGEHSDCLAATRDELIGGFMALDGVRIVILYQGPEGGDRFHYVTVWDGSSWTGDTATGIDNWDNGGYAFPYFVDGTIRALMAADNGSSFADIDLYGALADGSDWYKIDTILSGASGEGFNRVVPVAGGGTIVGMAMEAPSGNPDTSATASDLLPVYFIFDPAAEQHSHASDEDHDHDSDYSDIDHDHDDAVWMPLSTVVSGDPELVWEDDDSLIPTKVPNT